MRPRLRLAAVLAGNVRRGFLFVAIHRHAEITRPGLIHKFNNDVVAHAFHMAIAPVFEWEGPGGPAAVRMRPLVSAPGGVGFDFIRRAPGDIDPSAVSLPAEIASAETATAETLDCGCNPPVLLDFEL